MADSKVQIAPDNASTGFHSVRTETIVDSTGTTVEQQVVTLGDSLGSLALVIEGGKIPTSDKITQALLQAVILRLDILNAAIIDRYSPPDSFGL